jgi:hypothetical protein
MPESRLQFHSNTNGLSRLGETQIGYDVERALASTSMTQFVRSPKLAPQMSSNVIMLRRYL